MPGNVALMLADFWFGIISKVSSWILSPVIEKLIEYNWLSSDFLGILDNFIDDLVNYFIFAKKVICNITGLPQDLISILGLLLLFTFLLFISFLPIKFALNAWGLLITGRSINNGVKS